MGNVAEYTTPETPARVAAQPYTLTTEDLIKIIAAQKEARTAMKKREDYAVGNYNVRTMQRVNPDGSKKTEVIDNKIGEMIDRHVGFGLANGVKIQPREEGDKATVAFYDAVSEANDLDSMNSELYRECFIDNFSVEVHSFDPEFDGAARIRITHTPAHEWILIWDTANVLRTAIRTYCVGPFVFRDGVLIEMEKHVTVYTDTTITSYIDKSGDTQGGTLEPSGKPIQHEYDSIPIAWYSITENFDDYITKPMMLLQDHYNELLSDNGNAILLSSGKLLVISGYANTKENKDDAAEAKKEGVLLLAVDGEALALDCSVAVDKVGWQEERIRSALYSAGKVADTQRIIGSTGQVSGVALELLSMPQREFAMKALQYFSEGIRRRINLINAVQGKFVGKGFVRIDNYEVVIKPSIARVTQEIIQSLPAMENTVSRIDRLRMIPDIPDAEAANERFEEEHATAAMNTSAANALANPAAAVAQNEAAVAQGVPDMTAKAGELIDLIGSGLVDFLLKSGAADKLIAAKVAT